jgi:hypothetical protein
LLLIENRGKEKNRQGGEKMHTPTNKNNNNNFEKPLDFFQLELEEIEEIENAPDPEYLIGSIEEGNAFPIPKNGITVITAKSGGGKSLL